MAHVLIVEDATDLREVWAEALTQSGHTVETAPDGVEAIKKLGTQSYDVVLFDLNLPRLSGLEAIKLIRRTDTDLPILAITGGGDPTLSRAVITAGANDIFFKPITLDDLSEAIARYARQKPLH